MDYPSNGNVFRWPRREAYPGSLDSESARSIKSLLRLAGKEAPGPAPTFASPHLLLAFLTIASSSYVGREALAARSGVGKGAIRTILGKLRERGYVRAVRAGCFLTRPGERLAESIDASLSLLDSLPRSELSMGENQAALVLRGTGDRVRSGLEQRDSAIRIGASGATTYVIRSGRFTIPGGSVDCERDFPSKVWPILKSGLKPKNGDVVILCGAATEVSARLGALAAAITLL